MARLVLALAFCIGAANGLGKTLPDCSLLNGIKSDPELCLEVGESCRSGGGVCLQTGIEGIGIVCFCCDRTTDDERADGLVPETSSSYPSPPTPPYFDAEGTVIPSCR